MSRLLSSLVVAVVLGLTVVGTLAASQRGEGLRSVDAELVQMGREIPGFGGLFYDEEGWPNVVLLDPAGAGEIALKTLGVEARLQRGDYEFEQLLGWRQELRSLLALPGVVYLDVDERMNRVVVGFDASSKGADSRRLEEELAAKSVPRQAVAFRETARVRPLSGLRDKIRPVEGGLQVAFSGFACTLGFNAVRAGVLGFVVASHCTDVFGQVDGTQLFQSLPGAANAIGTEIADPPFFSDPPCPPGMSCRFSDSAFAKYTKPSLGGLGRIARPIGNGGQSGPLGLKTPMAHFTLKGQTGSPLVGEMVQKVGRTTGWTFGRVFATCADVNEGDATLLCQTMVQIGGGPGDSGAPVFVTLPGNNARLVGMLWGGADDPVLGIVGIFSPIENIEEDLGSLRVN